MLTPSLLVYTRPALSARYPDQGTREGADHHRNAWTHGEIGGSFTTSSALKFMLPSKENAHIDTISRSLQIEFPSIFPMKPRYPHGPTSM